MPTLAVTEAGPRDRLAGLAAAAGLAAWLLYTRAYATLVPLHATLPACPFLVVTGHPCPFCGGTRSFSAAWSGDLGRSFHLYPLGPVLFALSLLALPLLLGLALSGRRPALRLTHAAERHAYLALGAAVGVSWTLKLLVLGN